MRSGPVRRCGSTGQYAHGSSSLPTPAPKSGAAVVIWSMNCHHGVTGRRMGAVGAHHAQIAGKRGFADVVIGQLRVVAVPLPSSPSCSARWRRCAPPGP